MPLAVLKKFELFKVVPNGTASGRDFDNALATAIGTDTGLHAVVSGTTILYLYPSSDETTSRVKISRSSGTSSIVIETPSGASSVTLSHQSGTTGSGTGPSLYAIASGNFVLLSIATGSPDQMDVIVDKTNNCIGYISDTGTSFTLLDQSGNAHVIPLPDFVDTPDAVSLAPVVVPEMDIVYDDLFLASYMRAHQRIQQFPIGDNTYFASGNPYVGKTNAGQFVVRITPMVEPDPEPETEVSE